jgi:hypothetical protein
MWWWYGSKKGVLHIVGGNVGWYLYYGKQYEDFYRIII